MFVPRKIWQPWFEQLCNTRIEIKNWPLCSNSSYNFDGDIAADDADGEGAMEYPTPNGLTEASIFRVCTDVLVNSTVARWQAYDRCIHNYVQP
jgi:hypothetical protein